MMKVRIAKRSEEQGFARSRLPEFSKYEIKSIRGSADFMGINHYTTAMVKEPENYTPSAEPSLIDDAFYHAYFDESWPGSASSWLKVSRNFQMNPRDQLLSF
jgi:beta-glucosidase/6-phospho-beta-glucosidase/beta-galactosidase